MAKRVSNEDIININNLYYKNRNYTQTAKEVGFSVSTVRKYVIKDYVPKELTNKIIFNLEIPQEPDYSLFLNKDNWGELCVLSEEEKKEIEILWKEMVI